MRKNLLSHAEIIATSKEGALDLFKSVYGVNDSDLDTFFATLEEKGMTNFDKAYEAAHFIYESAVNNGLEKNEALAQITAVNLAALVTDWTSPSTDQRSLGAKIRRHYGDLVQESGANAIALLRQDVLKDHSTGSVQLNMFNEEKNPTNIQFSKHDLVDGVKLPSEFTNDLSYLLGVYRADGAIGRMYKNEFHIQGRNDDLTLYRTILEDKIEDLFGFVKKTSLISSSKTAKSTPRIDITSKTHFAYIRDVLHFINLEGKFNSFQYKLDDGNATAYLMGIIAGAGNLYRKKTTYSEWHQIQFKDKFNDYMSECQQIFDRMEIPYKFQESRSETYLNNKSTQSLLHYEGAPKITSDQIGLFTNPRHLEYIRENKLI